MSQKPASSLPKSHEILSRFLAIKKEKRPGFSGRRLADQLALSPAYINLILNGKKPLPESRIPEFAEVLELDDPAVEQLKRSLILERSLGEELFKHLRQSENTLLESSNYQEYTEISRNYYFLLEDWYYLPILDAIGCSDFEPDSHWLAKKVGISEKRAKAAWAKLLDSGCVIQREGRWQKMIDNIRFPTHTSHPSIRNFHQKNLQKISDTISTRHTHEDFNRRFLKGGSIATNAKSVEKAKKYWTGLF